MVNMLREAGSGPALDEVGGRYSGPRKWRRLAQDVVGPGSAANRDTRHERCARTAPPTTIQWS